MDLIINNYKEIIALIGSFTGLLGLVATFYYKYRDSNIKDKELELKQTQFNLDKQHQIRKDTYQQIFEKKIVLYKDLNDLLLNYKNRLHDVGLEIQGNQGYEVITEKSIAMHTFTKVIELIQVNIFFTSEDLELEFRTIKDLYNKVLYGFTGDKLLGVYGYRKDIEEAELDTTNAKFYNENKEVILKFFNLIENEIKSIKQDIGLI